MLQISARWDPDEACRPLVDEAPVFYPTVEVMSFIRNIFVQLRLLLLLLFIYLFTYYYFINACIWDIIYSCLCVSLLQKSGIFTNYRLCVSTWNIH